MSLMSWVLIATAQWWKGQMREQKQRHIEDTVLEELQNFYNITARVKSEPFFISGIFTKSLWGFHWLVFSCVALSLLIGWKQHVKSVLGTQLTNFGTFHTCRLEPINFPALKKISTVAFNALLLTFSIHNQWHLQCSQYLDLKSNSPMIHCQLKKWVFALDSKNCCIIQNGPFFYCLFYSDRQESTQVVRVQVACDVAVKIKTLLWPRRVCWTVLLILFAWMTTIFERWTV